MFGQIVDAENRPAPITAADHQRTLDSRERLWDHLNDE
jgi:hypothetical protein